MSARSGQIISGTNGKWKALGGIMGVEIIAFLQAHDQVDRQDNYLCDFFLVLLSFCDVRNVCQKCCK